jgi:hypothetical protein
MSTEFFCSVGNRHATRLDLYVPPKGAWYVDAILDDTTDDLSGPVVVRLGSLELHGTVLPAYSGAFVLARSMRIVGGAGGWGTLVTPEHYHDDSGVDALSVAQDAANIAGETLGGFDPAEPLLDADFVRQGHLGPASAVLEQAIGEGRTWWVDSAGVTQCGTRGTVEAAPGSYDLLTYSPLTRIATLAVDDPAALWVGTILRDRLSEPQTIRELEIHVQVTDGVGSCRALAWTGGDESSASRLGRAIDAVLDKRASRRLWGTYRYRVVSVEADSRLSLQPVSKVPGLPQISVVSQASGIAGGLSNPALGSIVRVGFDDGDSQYPYVSHWAPGNPENVSGIVRMSDLVQSGGYGTTITFSLIPCAPGGIPGPPGVALASPTGTVPVVVAGLPYLVSFGNTFDLDPSSQVPPPVPPLPLESDLVGPLYGYALSASESASIE